MLGRPWPSFRSGDEQGDVPRSLVSALSLLDRAAQDGEQVAETARRQKSGPPVQPVIDVVRAEVFQLGFADERDQVLVGHRTVLPDGALFVTPLQATLQPVVHRVGHGVVGRRLDARLQFLLQLPDLLADLAVLVLP